MVGSSGTDAQRRGEVTASARSLPSRTSGSTAEMLPNTMRDAPGEQIGHHRRDAAIGHMLDVDARHGLEQLAGEMLRGADAGRAEGELAGIARAHRRRARRTLFAGTSVGTASMFGV